MGHYVVYNVWVGISLLIVTVWQLTFVLLDIQGPLTEIAWYCQYDKTKVSKIESLKTQSRKNI
jgi:hypothetical protein